MSGIGLVLNIAKDALLTQQHAINVVSHNIANVSTEGYSRQISMITAKDAAPFAGLLFGRGVQMGNIESVTNAFIENRLHTATSNLSMMTEKETYMNVIENIFNETSESSISNQFNQFWNSWNDLNNNPSGMPERTILLEYGTLLAESLQKSSNDLSSLSRELNNSIGAGVNNVNQILEQIANVNSEILVVKFTGTPNDLIDKRNSLVNNLSEYMDINIYEDDQGSLSITTAKGFMLVNKNDSYLLDFDGNNINWQSNSTTITDDIKGGKLGGWLDLRDEIIPKYKSDLDELAKSTAWEINSRHSQGVGLAGFTSLAGSYKSSVPSEAMGTVDSGLDFYDKITDGSFKLWIYDDQGDALGGTTVVIDADTTSLAGLTTIIDGISIGAGTLNASIKDRVLNIEMDSGSPSGYTFAFSDDNSNILAALGINTFFTDSNAINLGINEEILANKNNIAAGTISNNVGHAIGAATNTSTGILTTAGPYTGTTDSSYEIEILAGGDFQWRKDSNPVWTVEGLTPGNTYTLSENVEVTFSASGSFDIGNTYSINVEQSSDTYGDFFPGDNTNSLNIANLQYENVTVKQWSYSRADGANSRDITNTTLDSYLHQMIGVIGIESQSIQREKEYNQTMQEQISQTRDNISGVSLDEEMANLIKYQHAYMAAAKLITTAEEMLDEILKVV